MKKLFTKFIYLFDLISINTKVIYILLLLMIICSISLHKIFGYPIYFGRYIGTFVVFVLCVIMSICAYFADLPKGMLAAKFFAIISLYLINSALSTPILPLSPFPYIDTSLANFSHMIGFSLPTLVIWIRKYPWLNAIFTTSYWLLEFEMGVAFFALSALGDADAIDGFVLTAIITTIIGFTIALFWPAIGPVAVFHQIKYYAGQNNLLHQIVEVHHNIPLKALISADISLPSFHIILAMICLFYVRRYKILFYLFLVINIFLCFSTLTTAWHYLADVIAGFIVVGAVIWFVEKIYKPYVKKLETA